MATQSADIIKRLSNDSTDGSDWVNVNLCFFSVVDETEGVSKFLYEVTAQWKNLALEVRSVRSMLEEVISNWEKYSSTVAALQAWLEDAEQMLNQSENAKRVSDASDIRDD